MTRHLVLGIVFLFAFNSRAQVNDHEIGAWYMYFWDTKFKKSKGGVLEETGFGLQGDIQLRNWNILGDLEQLLIRGGFTYSPKNTNAKFTLGYGDITTGTYGEFKSTTRESRIYQEALIPNKVGDRFYLKHRFRFEQRFVENQDFRIRYRYALFMNIPLNKKKLEKGALYLAIYDELFINGNRNIGNGSTVQIFDRNRLYGGLGYKIMPGLAVQLGFMQQTTNSWNKGQLQISLHNNIRFRKN